MKLYGIAIAAIPAEGSHVLDIVCTPISVEHNHPAQFAVEEDPIKTTIDTTKAEDVVGCYVELAYTVNKYTDLQEHSLKQRGLKYRPVPLYIGQDSTKPVDTALLQDSILFESGTPATPAEEIWLSSSTSLSLSQIGLGGSDGGFLPFSGQGIVAKTDNPHGRKKSIPEPYMSAEFRDANLSIAKLFKDKCVLAWGGYTRYSQFPPIDSLPQSRLDKHLIKLKRDLSRGTPDVQQRAHQTIINLAYARGKHIGERLKWRKNLFALKAPKELENDPAAQAKFPSYCFYYWHPAYKQAFYDGYYPAARKNSPYNQHLKLPLDPPNPPFTDPCANLIRDQFDIAYRNRKSSVTRDTPLWRRRISKQASRVATLVA